MVKGSTPTSESRGEQPAASIFIDGKKAVTLRGPTVAADFKEDGD
jgi:hypothetical protein